MEYIAETTEFQLHNSTVSLGKFDGLHIGHQLLIHEMMHYKQEGYQSVLFSFSYNPRNLFSQKDMKLIYTEEEKRLRAAEEGVDVFISYPFSKETASMEPEDFIKIVIVGKMDAKIVIVGNDFKFGHKRRGDVGLLQKMSKDYGYRVITFDKRKCKNYIVSSTLIRAELSKGNLSFVNELLGRPYRIAGTVMHGKKLGRTIGIPTANLIPDDNKLLPPNGVYVSKTKIDGRLYNSVSNIGIKPTVAEEIKKGIETYLFDYTGDLYGKMIEVELYHYQRKEKKFSSFEELSRQMQIDLEQAECFWKKQ